MQKAPSDRSPAIHQAMTEAQHLAFAPVSFMTASCLRRMSLLDHLFDALSEGLSVDELAARADLSPYAIHLLTESGLAIGALTRRGECFHLTKLGHVLRSDPMTDDAATVYDAMRGFAEKAGFQLERIIDDLGISHSLMIFKRA